MPITLREAEPADAERAGHICYEAFRAINEAHVFRFIPKPWQLNDLQDNIGEALAMRDRLLADQAAARAQPGQDAKDLTPQELEAQRLEAEEPGILRVKRAPDGSIIL